MLLTMPFVVRFAPCQDQAEILSEIYYVSHPRHNILSFRDGTEIVFGDIEETRELLSFDNGRGQSGI